MTRDDIIRMARDAGFEGLRVGRVPLIPMIERHLTQFAALVAAAEREACIEDVMRELDSNGHAHAIAAAIRARGEK